MSIPPIQTGVLSSTLRGTVPEPEQSSSSLTGLSVEQAKQAVITAVVRGATGSQTARAVTTSPSLARLAAKLGVSQTELAIRIDPDTIRRTRYPVIERTDADGKTVYEHPLV